MWERKVSETMGGVVKEMIRVVVGEVSVVGKGRKLGEEN